MKLENLSKTTARKNKRLGQGHGSGRGKTAGRGTKGQRARGKIPISFEGGAISLIKRLPFRRGKGRNKVFTKNPIVVNVKILNVLKKGDIVDIKTLVKNRIVNEKDAKLYGIKILGDGVIDIPLTVKIPISKGAKIKIEKAGGSVSQ